MEVFYSNKFKDDNPLSTIKRIKMILVRYNILVEEKDHMTAGEGFHSIKLRIKGTKFEVVGNGISLSYALASAYGKLVERLSNQAFFRSEVELSPRALEKEGFYYAQDEKSMTMSELVECGEKWINYQMKQVDEDTDIYELLHMWKESSLNKEGNDFIALPYMNTRNGELSYIPYKMLSNMYGDVGMCAGNSIEEALINGICEGLENHARRECLKGGITPPTVPNECIQKYLGASHMIKKINKGGNRVIIKDCSLGRRFPVIAAIMINNYTKKYVIQFASHPSFELALEKGLYKLVDGRCLYGLDGDREFVFSNKYRNIEKDYPAEFFGDNESYEFREFTDVEGWSTKEIGEHLKELLSIFNTDIYIRNNSYMEFPSYHVIIPGMSEKQEFSDLTKLNECQNKVKLKKFIRNIDRYMREDSIHILEGVPDPAASGQIDILGGVPLTEFVNIQSQVDVMPDYYHGAKQHKGTAKVAKKGYYEGESIYDDYLKDLGYRGGENTYEHIYYSCLRDYLGYKQSSMSKEEAMSILEKFYDKEMIEHVVDRVENPLEYLEKNGVYKCWDCKNCKFKNDCMQGAIDELYIKLKKAQDINTVNQNLMRNIL